MTFRRKRNEKERNRRRTNHCSRVCCVELESINWTRQMWPRSSIYRWFGSFRFHSFCNLFLRGIHCCEMLRRLKRSFFGENENFRRFAGDVLVPVTWQRQFHLRFLFLTCIHWPATHMHHAWGSEKKSNVAHLCSNWISHRLIRLQEKEEK